MATFTKMTYKRTNRLKKTNLPCFQENNFSDSDEDPETKFFKENSPTDLLNIAYTYIDKGEKGQAITKFDQILSHPQSNYIIKCKVHDMIAQVLISSSNNQLARAIKHCEIGIKLAQHESEFPYLYQTLARAQRNLGELNLSLQTYRKVKEIDPNDIELNEEIDLEILEIENILEKLKPAEVKEAERYLTEESVKEYCANPLCGKVPIELKNVPEPENSESKPEGTEPVTEAKVSETKPIPATVNCGFKSGFLLPKMKQTFRPKPDISAMEELD